MPGDQLTVAHQQIPGTQEGDQLLPGDQLTVACQQIPGTEERDHLLSGDQLTGKFMVHKRGTSSCLEASTKYLETSTFLAHKRVTSSILAQRATSLNRC